MTLNDDHIKYGVPFIETLGYKKHLNIEVSHIYLLTEKDGYINIYLDKHINRDVIHFQKCFNDDPNFQKIINEYFYNVDDLITFVTKFHIKNIRFQKLKKLNENR